MIVLIKKNKKKYVSFKEKTIILITLYKLNLPFDELKTFFP